MDQNTEKSGLSSEYGSMNIHNVYQQNGSKSLMNYNDRDDMDMNSNLHNGYVSNEIGILNSHTLTQYNLSSILNEMNMGV